MNPWFAKAAILAAVIAMMLIRAPHGKRSRTVKVAKTRRGPLEAFLLAVAWMAFLMPIVWVATPWLAFADMPLHPLPLVTGGCLLALGLWLFHRSHADLGTNWSVTLEIRESHRLVTEGVYRRIRHPMYSALLLYGVGQALVVPNWIAGPSYALAMMLLVALRLGPEEQLMRGQFTGEYDAYASRTKRLIPGVWLLAAGLLVSVSCSPRDSRAGFDRVLYLETSSDTSANVSIGDVNGDGQLDLVLAKGRHWPLVDRVLLGDGRGHIVSAYSLGDAADRTYSGLLANLDADGDLDDLPDIIVANRPTIVENRPASDAANYICLNRGQGRFDADCLAFSHEPATTITPADFNHDGLIDLAVPYRLDIAVARSDAPNVVSFGGLEPHKAR